MQCLKEYNLCVVIFRAKLAVRKLGGTKSRPASLFTTVDPEVQRTGKSTRKERERSTESQNVAFTTWAEGQD